MKEIELTQGKVALVDDDDFEELNQFKWHVKKDHNRAFYAARVTPRPNRRLIFMHRQILKDIPEGMEVDHVNGNGLDNRRSNLLKMKKGGFFISVEGIDGAGKSTVVRHLVKGWFPGAVVTRQPLLDIRLLLMRPEITAECEALLAAASLRYAIDTVIKPALIAGKIVISDRFHDSMIAYQGYGRGLEVEWLEELLPQKEPDFTILLDCDPKVAANRIKYRGGLDRIEMENLDFHRKVRAGFLDQAEWQYDRVVVVNAERPLDDVLKDVDKEIQEVYHEKR
jgi:dTMP kinase